MFSFDIDCWQDEKDLRIAELFEAGSVGITEMDGFVRAFFEEDADRAALRAQFPEGREAAADERDWVAYSQEQLTPRVVGRSFFRSPSGATTRRPKAESASPSIPDARSAPGTMNPPGFACRCSRTICNRATL
jgi:hypothetical protein